ncbi:MAG: alpha/beta-type small acid-soluble spore protein [Peptococcaceae bacterium]|nr:alpha/beta-type small acid-soluble spore protein [Peptococcaceae bacterium]
MNSANNSDQQQSTPLTSELEKFKYEVAQEIGLAGRKAKKIESPAQIKPADFMTGRQRD